MQRDGRGDYAPPVRYVFFTIFHNHNTKLNSILGVVVMSKIKLSFDNEQFSSKPTDVHAAYISNRIGRSVKELHPRDLLATARDISLDGHTFCPATFRDGKRSKETFEQQQLFALDFDGGISFEQVQKHARDYKLPICFAYDTFGNAQDKFRVVFLNDVPVTDRIVAEAMLRGLGTIFPEADSSCWKDVSKMYYGGGGNAVRYVYDEYTGIPLINIELLFRSLTNYYEDKQGPTNLPRNLEKFSRETGLSLTGKKKLDVSVTDELPVPDSKRCPTESNGANPNDKNSPTTIVYPYSQYIKGVGEKLSKRYYIMKFGLGCTTPPSVGQRRPGNHLTFRSAELGILGERCRLYKEFESGERRLTHDELFGIITNLIQIESGARRFMEILRMTSRYGKRIKEYKRWEQTIRRIKETHKPSSCNGFCPFKDDCNHGKNLLFRPKRGIMERLPGYEEAIEDDVSVVEQDVYRATYKAYRAGKAGVYVIKAMTGAGKTTTYLFLMLENPGGKFLIVAPTNLLKNEIFIKAIGKGIDVVMTPSLEEIKDEMPSEIWDEIEWLYKTGRHRSVHPYIHEVLKRNDIPCLVKYMAEREKIKDARSSVITTHRYMLTMDEKRLNQFDTVIIDEDIIFKSVISNQGEISLSDMKRLAKEVSDRRVVTKVKKLLKLAKTSTCIELDSFDWEADEDDPEGISTPFDIPSFCSTEKFYIRRSSTEKNLTEDTVTFIKPVSFKENVKYIMVSATANEKICCDFFHYLGIKNIIFHECKKARYMGELHQYPQKSMSRTCIGNNPNIIDRLMGKFDIGKDRVISFKKFSIGQLHYGNTEGCNIMEGEDILVIGTPFHAEFLYKLVAFTMGLPFDEDEEISYQYVTHNGHGFWFTTYKDENLRAIQFWMIESELEQAVGRARLLRHDCTVHLFSSFPLSQAQIRDFDYGLEKDSTVRE